MKNALLSFFVSICLCQQAAAQDCADWGSFKTTIKEGNNVEIWWKNVEYSQTFKYDIEASYNGQEYKTIGSLTGLQNYSGATPYVYQHDTPLLGINYYRIKRTLVNGDSCYSSVLTAVLDKKGIQLAEMYPNPASDYLRVSFFSSRFENVTLTFYNLAGTTAVQEVFAVGIGKNTLFYNVENLERGWYSVEIKNKEVAVRQRILIQ